MKKPLLLVDAYSQIYRGYYAIRSLSTAEGVPTNALFAMAKLLLSLHQQYGDRNGAFVFDKGKCTKRIALLESYKSNRPPMPEDLRSQIEPLRELIRAFGWPIVECEGVEADDLMGKIAKESDQEVLILSSDKDLSQLVTDRIRMLVPDKDGKGLILRDEEAVKTKFGVPPSGIVDYLALIGDASDNIPGVEGVGPKTAANLIAEHGSIAAIYADLSKVKRESLRQKLADSAATLELNRKLITLDEEVCCDNVDLERSAPCWEKIREMASAYELKSILKEVEKLSPGTDASSPGKKEPPQTTQMEFDF